MPTSSVDFSRVAARVRADEIGRAACIATPFGSRRICYADLTATGRHLHSVESWFRRSMPFYANTHTEISTTGRMMTGLREEARRTIRRAVNAGDDDEVIFVGSGATAAVNKLVGLLGLRIPEPLERTYALTRAIPPDERPVVLVGPYEHHSNELPWLESIAEVVEIGLAGDGALDLAELEARLAEYAGRTLVIGSFSAASNVTGVISDVETIARVLHEAGALAFFDYAAAAPYVPIDMHPAGSVGSIDALFLSPHKFVGGPGASGVLVAHRRLFRTRTPERPGGGTVDYVAGPRREDVDYISRLHEREEGGTPAIQGDIRAAVGFLITERAGPRAIREHEIALAERAAERLTRNARIRVLGPRGLPRLAIVPIEIEGLHHDLVSSLLDHLFGIQNRSGCSCAGPYGHRLLGIDPAKSGIFRELVRRGINGIKPGWARLSLPWYASDEDIDFMLTAVEFVADHGMDFVPLYRFGWRNAVWRHLEPLALAADVAAPTLDELWPEELPPVAAEEPEPTLGEDELRSERSRYMSEARELAASLHARWQAAPPRWNPPTGNAELDDLVWFRYVEAEGLENGV